MITSDLPQWAHEFLHNKIGISRKNLRHASLKTRLYHDLGIYGDEGDWFIEAMQEEGVDMAHFDCDRYFPPESYGKSLITSIACSCIPFLKSYLRKRKKYQPLTLEMICNALLRKKWLE